MTSQSDVLHGYEWMQATCSAGFELHCSLGKLRKTARIGKFSCAIGRGPRQKNGKILTELSFFAVFNHKNDLEKVSKSRNEFRLVGLKVEKMVR